MRDGFVKVAAATPKIRVADCEYNAGEIVKLAREAAELGVKVLTFPELCVTGYTCGDLFLQNALLDGAESALERILKETAELDMLIALGLPVRHLDKLYNCAALIHRGRLLALVPKTHLPNYGEFYEKRWFTSGEGVRDYAKIAGQNAPLYSGMLLDCKTVPGLTVGVEICEDLWTADPPSTGLARAGPRSF